MTFGMNPCGMGGFGGGMGNCGMGMGGGNFSSTTTTAFFGGMAPMGAMGGGCMPMACAPVAMVPCMPCMPMAMGGMGGGFGMTGGFGGMGGGFGMTGGFGGMGGGFGMTGGFGGGMGGWGMGGPGYTQTSINISPGGGGGGGNCCPCNNQSTGCGVDGVALASNIVNTVMSSIQGMCGGGC